MRSYVQSHVWWFESRSKIILGNLEVGVGCREKEEGMWYPGNLLIKQYTPVWKCPYITCTIPALTYRNFLCSGFLLYLELF